MGDGLPLMMAAKNGALLPVRFLLDNGAEITAVNVRSCFCFVPVLALLHPLSSLAQIVDHRACLPRLVLLS